MISRPTGLLLLLCGFTLLIILGVASQVDALLPGLDSTSVLASVFFFDRFVLDFLLVLLVGMLLMGFGLAGRVLCYAWCTLFFITSILQLLSIYIGGEFVTFLAVDNINHISLMINPGSMLGVAGVVLLVMVFVVLLEKFCYQPNNGKVATAIVLGALAAAVAIHQGDRWLPGEIAAARDSYYASKSNRIAHKSPMESFYKVLFREKSDAIPPLTQDDIDRAREHGIRIQPDRRFPLVRDRIYSTPLPFGERQNETPPNVIVFFAEGMSARTLNIYNDFEPELTPNLAQFASQSMVVKNYYNHTYATYRGLQGQLCSFFPAFGGHGGWDTHYDELKQINYFCLSDLLNNAGYETIFLDTHRRDFGFVDEMMAELNFDRIYTAEDMVERYLGEEPLRRDSLSDNQLMRGLVGLLKDREKDRASGDPGAPFFLTLYSLETHAFQRIRKDGKSYPLKQNYILDSIHNFDYAFGRFWDYLRNSTLYENTVVVFTSDHAHYPDRDFRQVVSEEQGYQPYFVDRIPLVIHDPGRKLPASFDANFASSIDFAPSMAHFFNLGNGPNPFVGNSIFDSAQSHQKKSLASAGPKHYLITPEGITASDPQGNNSEELRFVEYLVRTLQQIEQHDRIWPQ